MARMHARMATRALPQIVEIGGIEMVKRSQKNLNGGEEASRKCPSCYSNRIWKDGIRRIKNSSVQRYICRDCDYRFSETSILLTNLNHNGKSQVCAILTEAKNLTRVEPLRSGLAGATPRSNAVNEFTDQLKRDGYSPLTIKACFNYLDLMERKDVNILKPEQVKAFIAEQKWQNHSKATVVTYYGIFLKTMHIQWNPPRYRYERKIPFIPLENEIDSLIAGCGRKMSVFLRLLKETGARVGEALRLRWRDFDFQKSIVAINNPEKSSLARALPISPTLKAMLNSLPKNNNRVFGTSMNTMQSNFRQQRNRLAVKLKNPRLKQITFHTFRHFFATMLYAKTLNILKVQQALGHKNINNTLIYTQLIDFKSEEYDVQVAETVGEAKKLGEAGFELYDTIDRCHLYRIRK